MSRRKEVYGYIKKHPGSVPALITKETGMQRSLVYLYLHKFEKQGKCIIIDGFYFAKEFPYDKAEELLQSNRDSILELLVEKDLDSSNISKKLKIPRQIVQQHLKLMKEKDQITRNSYGRYLAVE